MAKAVAAREPVSAPRVLWLIDKHRSDRDAAQANGSNSAKSLDLYALLGGSAMHREAYRAVERRRSAQQAEGA